MGFINRCTPCYCRRRYYISFSLLATCLFLFFSNIQNLLPQYLRTYHTQAHPLPPTSTINHHTNITTMETTTVASWIVALVSLVEMLGACWSSFSSVCPPCAATTIFFWSSPFLFLWDLASCLGLVFLYLCATTFKRDCRNYSAVLANVHLKDLSASYNFVHPLDRPSPPRPAPAPPKPEFFRPSRPLSVYEWERRQHLFGTEPIVPPGMALWWRQPAPYKPGPDDPSMARLPALPNPNPWFSSLAPPPPAPWAGPMQWAPNPVNPRTGKLFFAETLIHVPAGPGYL
ncbi:hypothetical protein BDV97DRAFT_181478 [Delphinella strobiligena]|nr:hypothetical protein BDV97DRAFT_181478 [Delphinella strobiligena]